ncbi:MAG: hypothetical protein ABFD08_09810 [Syntrophomonas sp.]
MKIASVVQTQNMSTSPSGNMANKGYPDKKTDFAQCLKTVPEKTEPKPLGSADALGTQKLFKYAHGNVIHGNDIQKELDEDLVSFKATINKMFKQLGIDTSTPVELQVDQQGYVRVTNNHPDKEKIEQMFKDNENLRNTYVKIQSFTEVLESGCEAIAFQKAYAKNSQAAVAQYSYLFNEDKHSPRFYTSLTNSNGVWRVDVNPMEMFKSRYQPHSSEYPSTSWV